LLRNLRKIAGSGEFIQKLPGNGSDHLPGPPGFFPWNLADHLIGLCIDQGSDHFMGV
jgi:hypothetical protein